MTACKVRKALLQNAKTADVKAASLPEKQAQNQGAHKWP